MRSGVQCGVCARLHPFATEEKHPFLPRYDVQNAACGSIEELSMAYDIRLMKLVTGELTIGKYDAEKDCLNEVAAIQSIPTQQGVQMVMLPYGYPFEPEFSGSIEGKNFLYRYANTPKELQDKYIEASSNLTVAGGLGKLQFSSEPFTGSGSGLIK